MTIRQICPPSLPVFAVYRVDAEGNDPEHLALDPCPVMGLLEIEGESPIVSGLVKHEWGFDHPNLMSNFVGYAHSQRDAEAKYGEAKLVAREPTI